MKILATVILQASLIRFYLNFLKNLIIIINYYYYYSFLILFVFMFWLLFITVISAVRWVTTNDQKITGYPRLYISNTFLSILAVPNKALFALLQHCMLCLHFQGPLSLQGQFLYFS